MFISFPKGISRKTLARTALLLLALLNQLLNLFGLRPLPIESEELNTFLSTSFTLFAALWSWWKNNSFTPEAVSADRYLKRLKSKK